VSRKALINIRVSPWQELAEKEDRKILVEHGAWTTYDGIENDKKKFSVIINAYQYNKSATKPWVRLKAIMLDLGHEMIHIKQYLNNELFDYKSGDVRFKGKIFASADEKDEEAYYNSPWEIEAYGRAPGLYNMYKHKLIEEAKAKLLI
jgi:hypothetical protein